MKALTTILLTLLVLGGCATTTKAIYTNAEKESFLEILNNEGWLFYPKNYIATGKIYSYSDKTNEQIARYYGVKVDKEKHEIQIKTDRQINFRYNDQEYYLLLLSSQTSFEQGRRYQHKKNHPRGVVVIFENLCRSNFGEELKKIDASGITSDSKNSSLLYYPEIIKASCVSKQELFEQDKLEKTKKCKTYGFEEDTDGMIMCFMELEKLKTEEMRRKFNKYNNNAVSLTESKDQQRQREAQALIFLGAAISGAGTPRSTTPKAPITTYPNSFSSTLTVPSNQVCPILSTPITKQEVRGSNRICYYQ